MRSTGVDITEESKQRELLAKSGLKHLKDGEAEGSLRSVLSVEEGRIDPDGNEYHLGEGAVAIGAYTQATGFNSQAEGMGTTAKGNESHAEGLNTIASGRASHAEGDITEASGYESHAEGHNTHAEGGYSHAEGVYSNAKGVASHSEGNNTEAIGGNSHAEGIGTKAEGDSSHAEGNTSVAKGSASHAEGYSTTVSGDYSHAEGQGTIVQEEAIGSHAEGYQTVVHGEVTHEDGTTTKGDYAHAEGESTQAYGRGSHAEGSGTQAKAQGSHAEGNGTIANGQWSHAAGQGTTANGMFSHAEGMQSVTEQAAMASHAEGYQCVTKNNFSHAEGNVTIAEGFASHAEGGNNTAKGQFSHAEGNNNVANAQSSHVEGASNTVSENGMYSHAEGNGNKVDGIAAHAEGQQTTASSLAAHAEGWGTKASTTGAPGAHAEGVSTNALAMAAHAEGSATTASGDASHSEGAGSQAIGTYSHAEGMGTQAQGNYSHAEGSGSVASGESSHAGGYGTIASNLAQTAIGKYNKDVDSLFSVGNGEYDEKTKQPIRRDAFRIERDGKIYILDKNGNEVLLQEYGVSNHPESVITIAKEEEFGEVLRVSFPSLMDAEGNWDFTICQENVGRNVLLYVSKTEISSSDSGNIDDLYKGCDAVVNLKFVCFSQEVESLEYGFIPEIMIRNGMKNGDVRSVNRIQSDGENLFFPVAVRNFYAEDIISVKLLANNLKGAEFTWFNGAVPVYDDDKDYRTKGITTGYVHAAKWAKEDCCLENDGHNLSDSELSIVSVGFSAGSKLAGQRNIDNLYKFPENQSKYTCYDDSEVSSDLGYPCIMSKVRVTVSKVSSNGMPYTNSQSYYVEQELSGFDAFGNGVYFKRLGLVEMVPDSRPVTWFPWQKIQTSDVNYENLVITDDNVATHVVNDYLLIYPSTSIVSFETTYYMSIKGIKHIDDPNYSLPNGKRVTILGNWHPMQGENNTAENCFSYYLYGYRGGTPGYSHSSNLVRAFEDYLLFNKVWYSKGY